MDTVHRYVLTGAPGSGKSSILRELERRGEITMTECAEEHIVQRQQEGCARPWEEPGFQDGILELQLAKEATLPPNRRAFLDRGIHDGLAYTTPGDGTYERIMAACAKVKYAAVLFIEPLPETMRTTIRREDRTRAGELGERLLHAYRDAGYHLIRIAPGTVEERVHWIDEAIKRYNERGD